MKGLLYGYELLLNFNHTWPFPQLTHSNSDWSMRRRPKAESKLLKTICRAEHSLTSFHRISHCTVPTVCKIIYWREHLSREWHQCVYLGRRGGGQLREQHETFLAVSIQVMESQMYACTKHIKGSSPYTLRWTLTSFTWSFPLCFAYPKQSEMLVAPSYPVATNLLCIMVARAHGGH